MKCKICQHEVGNEFRVNMSRVIGEPVRDEPDMVSYWVCESCGFVFSTYLDGYSLQQLRDSVYNDVYWTKIDPADRSQFPLMFAQRLHIRRGSRILDFGCGSGKGVEKLCEKGYDAYGYDIGADFAFRERCSNNWKDLPDSFDFVFSFEVLEHLTDPLDFFQRSAAFTAQGGMIFFTTYLMDESQGREFWYIAPRNGHVSILSSKTIRYLSGHYGYEYLAMFRPHLHCFIRPHGKMLRKEMIRLKYGATAFQQQLFGRVRSELI